MASLLIQSGDRRGYRIQFRTKDKRKRSIWLGDISKRDATKFHSNLESLIESSRVNATPDAAVLEWVEGLDKRFRSLLVQYGLVQDTKLVISEEKDIRCLEPFLETYIEGRTDLDSTTIVKFQNTRDWTVRYFGAKCLLSSISPAKFESWMRWMTHSKDESRKALAISTANKHAKRLRQMLAFAVKMRLIKENVGQEVRIGDEANEERKFYIDRPTSTLVLDACPNLEWKLIFALARYCGLRCPTEIQGLKWSDVHWDSNRLRIDSKKTGLRFCPIFQQVLPLLQAAFDAAKEGTVYVVQHRGQTANLRTHMLRIIEQAGVKPWPKLFVNLRSSCRTDLEDTFREAVINAWIGHSTRIGQKHYSQVRPSDWEAAAGFGGSTGGSITANQGGISSPHENEKTLNSLGNEGSRCLVMDSLMPPQGLEPWTR